MMAAAKRYRFAFGNKLYHSYLHPRSNRTNFLDGTCNAAGQSMKRPNQMMNGDADDRIGVISSLVRRVRSTVLKSKKKENILWNQG
jgi:hypothetical protein